MLDFQPAFAARPAKSAGHPGESIRWKKLRRNWLGPREGPLFLIALTDEAAGRTVARLTRENSVEENLETLRQYVATFGRPVQIRTDRSTLFGQQIFRALKEIGIRWIPAETPREPGLSAQFFDTASECLPDELTSAGVRTFEGAVRYLESVYLARWNGPVSAAAPTDRHRPLPAEHDLESICSVVLPRKFLPARSIRVDGTHYSVSDVPDSVVSGEIRVEKRAGGELKARWNGKLVTLTRVDERPAPPPSSNRRQASLPRKTGSPNRSWMNGFFAQSTLPIWKLYR